MNFVHKKEVLKYRYCVKSQKHVPAFHELYLAKLYKNILETPQFSSIKIEYKYRTINILLEQIKRMSMKWY